ncbi:polysaccharide lyase [Kiritimatiellota bacterium B12222]|nr:polysaccharide lyase [Kiritimatiellota bacterium B12222]
MMMRQNISTLYLCGLLAATPFVFSQAQAVTIENSSFQDTDGNGFPDGWSAFPDGKGESTRIEIAADGGVHLYDSDGSNGVGLLQWVPVKAGKKYQVVVKPEGSGGGFVYMIFAPKIPNKASDLNHIKLAEKREWVSAGKEKTISAVAPAGSSFMQLWIYSPNGNTNCDLTFKNIAVTEMEGAAVSAAPVAAPASSGSSAAQVTAGALTFTDADGDGIPDGWSAYPPAKGNGTAIQTDAEGVHLTDTDAGNGLGIIKWMPVTAGKEYEAVVTPGGSGGGFLYMIFAPKIPNKASDLNRTKLAEERQWISAGKEKRVKVKAPAGAKVMQLWLYSPKDNVNCELVIPEILLNVGGQAAVSSGAGASVARPPEPPAGAESYKHYNPLSILPEETLSVVDFESADFSQVRTTEGGTKLIVAAPEPVRSGKFAMKVMMDHKNIRSEMTGYRSAAYGEYKYGWSIFIPENFDGQSSFSIVTQWHDWGTGKEYVQDGGPPTSMYISNDTWRMKLRYQDGMGGDKLTKKEFSFGSIDADRGKWTDFVLEVNWQSPKSGGGYFRLFKDGEQVIDYEGPTWYEEKVQGPFFKMGVYKGAGSWKGDESRAYMYFDEFRMGDASVTKDQVDPAKQPGS